eukprot:CAMPEP_0204136100 /NCGR_PEP_ID=MMETSP0361-20130328/16638_1 /ASSEMBLY_ACC=CAM_ASM_000343 /TAXON_ID=268821 /ORGANISM="Scrippsiella Hangoei, Strain SHTV-5" /LENGTH=33 /DNA_ID= /DNA_START= /DNA_END= /DNA_ORIENTATION=
MTTEQVVYNAQATAQKSAKTAQVFSVIQARRCG